MPPLLTSFYMDCMSDPLSQEGNTECKDFKGLFAAKELVPEDFLTSCGKTDPDSGNARDPWQRQHYIHETNTGMWYHCCETRNKDRFTFNSGPPLPWEQGPFMPGFGPDPALAEQVKDQLAFRGGSVLNEVLKAKLKLMVGVEKERKEQLMYDKLQMALVQTVGLGGGGSCCGGAVLHHSRSLGERRGAFGTMVDGSSWNITLRSASEQRFDLSIFSTIIRGRCYERR